MEMLQILKYRFRNERLSFTDDLVSDPRELSVIDVPPEVITELLADGRIGELQELLESSWREWDTENGDGSENSRDVFH